MRPDQLTTLQEVVHVDVRITTALLHDLGWLQLLRLPIHPPISIYMAAAATGWRCSHAGVMGPPPDQLGMLPVCLPSTRRRLGELSMALSSHKGCVGV